MARTSQEMADLYESAINRIVTGAAQSVTVDGQSFTHLSLTQLEAGLKYWRAKAQEDGSDGNGGGGFVTNADISCV